MVRHGPQLMFDRAQCRTHGDAACTGVIDIDLGQIEPDRIGRGDPAQSPTQVGARNHMPRSTIGSQAQQARWFVDIVACAPAIQRQGQCGDQGIGAGAVQQPRQSGEQRLGYFLGGLEFDGAQCVRLIDRRIEFAGADQRIGIGEHAAPMVESGDAAVGMRVLDEGVRPPAHRCTGLGQHRCNPDRHLCPCGDQVLHQNSQRRGVDGDGVHHNQQSARSRPGSGVADRIEPDTLQHNAIRWGDSVRRGIQFGYGVFAQIERVRGGIEFDAVHQRVDIDRSGLVDP